MLNLEDGDWWDFAEQFLRDISEYRNPELTTRQAEYLLKLRDDKEKHFKIADGLSVATLIDNCYCARFELLDDNDVEFVERLHQSGRAYVTGRQKHWFVRICKQLNEIEGYVA